MLAVGANATYWLSAFFAGLGIIGGAIYTFLRVRGDTRDAVEAAADKRVEEMRDMVEQFRTAYETSRTDALEQRERAHRLENEAASLRMKTDQSAVIKEIAAIRSEMGQHFDEFTSALKSFGVTQQAMTAALQAIERRLSG